MLKRIHIQGYKSLEDIEVSLSQLVVLLGPNGAGKSNLLDALQLLSKLGTSRTLKEAFDPPYRGKPLESFTIGQKGIKGLLEQETLSFSIEADLSLSDAIINSVNRQIVEMRRPHRRRLGLKREASTPPTSANATCATALRLRCCPGRASCA